MLIGHSVVYLAARLVPGIVGVLTAAILTRLFDPVQYGVYGLLLVTMTLVASVGFDWLGVAFLRFFEARRQDPLLLPTFIFLFAGLVASSALIAAIGLMVMKPSGSTTTIYLTGLVLAWCYAWFEFTSRFAVANFQPTHYLLLNLSRAILIFLGVTVAAWLTRDPIWVGIGMGAGVLASTVFARVETVPTKSWKFDPVLAVQILRFGLPLALSLGLAAAVISGNRLLLEFLDSRESLGLYTAAFVLVQNSATVVGSGIAVASYQLAVQAVEEGEPAKVRRTLMENGTLLLAILAPTCLGMALTAEGLAEMLVGAQFRSAVTELTPIMAAGAFFAGIRYYFFDYAFHFGHRPRLQLWASGTAALLTIGLSIFLIPRHGAFGAAVAVAIGMAVSCVVAALVGRKAYVIPLPVEGAIQVTVCCCIMAVCVWLVPGEGASRFVGQVALGATAYSCVALSLNLLESRSRLTSYVVHRYAAWRGSNSAQPTSPDPAHLNSPKFAHPKGPHET